MTHRLHNVLPEGGISFRILITVCLFSTLLLTAGVSLWLYYINMTQTAESNQATFESHQQELTALNVDALITQTKNTVSLISHDNVLKAAIQAKDTEAIQDRLNEVVETSYLDQVDILVFFPVRQQTPIIGGHTPYDLDTLITELTNTSHNTKGFRYIHSVAQSQSSSQKSGDNTASGFVYSTELVAGRLNKRIGFLHGITLLNDNYRLLNSILHSTKADAIAITEKRSSNIVPLAWVNTKGDQPKHVIETQALHHFNRFELVNEQLNPELVVTLWNETSIQKDNLRRFKQSLTYVIFVALVLVLLVAYIVARISSRSLSYLNYFAKTKTTKDANLEFTPTVISEINEVGDSIEQAVQALAQNEEMYRNILNNSAAVVYLRDTEGKFQFVNTEFERVTGHTLGEVLGKTNRDVFSPEVAKQFTDHDNIVINEERVLNFREDLHTGHETLSYISVKFPLKDQYDRVKYVCGFSTDITEIINTQEELRKEKARAEEATDQVNSLNKNLADIITKKTIELEKAQENLIQSEKLASLGSLVAGISHELNTPIGTALTVTSTMDERLHTLQQEFNGGSLTKRAMEGFIDDLNTSCQILHRSLAAAIELISSFKQLSVDQTSDQRRTFTLSNTIEEVATTHKYLLRGKHVQLLAHVGQDIELDSYPGALTQVLNNLINNALIHAFEEDQPGTLTLTANAELVTQGKAPQVIISVSDNGKGIPPDDLKKVFDPFFTTRMGRGGTGLGMHIVHSIVTGILGGKIELHSRHTGLNTGTDIRLTIPAKAPVSTLDSE
jgi:PAS domain S-box-containing protein